MEVNRREKILEDEDNDDDEEQDEESRVSRERERWKEKEKKQEDRKGDREEEEEVLEEFLCSRDPTPRSQHTSASHLTEATASRKDRCLSLGKKMGCRVGLRSN